MWCERCQFDVDVAEDGGVTACVYCGGVLDEGNFETALQFTKGDDGEGAMVGQLVGESGQARGARFHNGRMYSGGGESHEAAVSKGRMEIAGLVDALRITPIEDTIEASHRFYRLALQHNFTRGRRVNQVAAVCIYIHCRQEKKAYMMIDFSDQLSINVFELGKVYVQLLQKLCLDRDETFTKPIDPSLYLYRFVDRLKPGNKKKELLATAGRLVQSMKRDWMQTGRRPSGVCGAALYLAAHIHGIEYSKVDVMSVVHVGWHTIEKRVNEFAHSAAADFTVDEFEQNASNWEKDKEATLLQYEKRLALPAPPDTSQDQLMEQSLGEADGQIAVVDEEARRLARLQKQAKTGACEHVDHNNAPVFAHGMCRDCFEEYLEISGGQNIVGQGADPPAFTRGIIKDIRKQVASLPLQPSAAGLSFDKLTAPPEVLLLEDGRSNKEPVDPDLAPELNDMEAALQSAELGRLTRALGQKPQDGTTTGSADASRHPDNSQKPTSKAGASSQPSTVATIEASEKQQPNQMDGGNSVSHDVSKAAGGRDKMSALDAVSGAMVLVPDADDDVTLQGHPDKQIVPVDEDEDGDKEQEEQGIDTLSDVDDEEVDVYLASAEEAEVRSMLWTEMNKDWIDKQAAKAAKAARDQLEGKTKPKRSYTRKARALPPAETAQDGVKNMLDAKKLSNKINYDAFNNLFKDDMNDRAPSESGDVAVDVPTATEKPTETYDKDADVNMAEDAGIEPEPAAASQKTISTQSSMQGNKRKGSTMFDAEFLDHLSFSGKETSKRAKPNMLGSLKPRPGRLGGLK